MKWIWLHSKSGRWTSQKRRQEPAFHPGILLTSHATLGQLLCLSDSPLGGRGSACRVPTPAPQFILLILTTNVMVLGGEASGRWLGHEGRGLMNGISVLIKIWRNQSSPFLPGEDARKRQPSENQKRALTRPQPCCYLDLGLPVSTTMRNKFLLFISHLVRRTFF